MLLISLWKLWPTMKFQTILTTNEDKSSNSEVALDQEVLKEAIIAKLQGYSDVDPSVATHTLGNELVQGLLE